MLSVRLHLRRMLPGPRRPRHDITSNERSISTGTCGFIHHRYHRHRVLFERSCTEATFCRWQPVPHIAKRRARSCVVRSISSHRVPVEEEDCEDTNSENDVTSAKVKPAQRQEDVTTSPPTRHSTNRKDDSDGKNNSPQLKEEEEVETTTVIRRLASLARPEWNLILGAAATLGITSTVTLVLPYASGQVLDLAIDAASSGDDPSSSTFSPATVAAGLFGLTAVAGIGVYARSLLLTTAGNRIVSRMRRRLFAAAVSQDVAFFDRTGTGDLISRLSADAQLVQAAVTTQAVGALRGVVMSAGSSALLFYTSPTLAVASLASLPPVFVAARYFGARLRERQARVQEMHAGATSVAEEVFRGIRTVRQFAAEEREVDRYGEAVRAAHDEAVRAGRAQAAFDATVHVAANGAILGVLGYGGTMVLSGTLSAGDLAGFLMYSLLVAGNVSSLSSTYAEFMKAAAASGRIFSVIDRVPEIPPAFSVDDVVADRDPCAVSAAEVFLDADTVCNEARSSPSHHVVPLSVEFRNVVFAYPTRSDVSVLNNFSLDIRPGEVVAIVGVSGGGKSTVASLLTRLYDVADGPRADAVDDVGGGSGVFVDGKDIRALDPRWLRTNIGVVAQEPLLFAGTIFDNIKYGRWSATDDEVREAARVAHVTAFADALPDGLYTCVGQGGTQLSGGQRQRVAIGRTVLKDPPIVVLDEATSALDAESERHIHEAISTVMRGRTVISIAHRLSTIREADRIAVLQDGTVVEDGKFEELLSRDRGLFVDLMGKQITR